MILKFKVYFQLKINIKYFSINISVMSCNIELKDFQFIQYISEPINKMCMNISF